MKKLIMGSQINICKKHKMPDGTIMEGPVHGPGQECVEWANGYKKGGKIVNPLYKGKFKKTARHYSAGGMLVGPSHENGGIPVIVDGVEPIEVEGGEFIINKQTVDSVGEDFLHKLNSTDTTHHTGGFQEGQLPGPSQFKDGGKVNNRRSKVSSKRKVSNKGKTPSTKMARGGRIKPSRPMTRKAKRRMLNGGGMANISGKMRTKPVRFGDGGMTTNPVGMGSTHYRGTDSSCRKLVNDINSCNNQSGCHYDYQRELCVGR